VSRQTERQPAVRQPANEPAAIQQQAQQQPAASQATTSPTGGSNVSRPVIPAEPPAETRQPQKAEDPVAASSLQRTRYVAPKYPRAAQRRGITGWVDVAFTVDIDGSVTDITVRESDPGDTFVNAAINSVEKWEFEPVIENGVAIQKRAAVRMMFAIK
jgi:protein TonB